MRNLKRALSLALASVMVIGMMVVGASAASYGRTPRHSEAAGRRIRIPRPWLPL